MPNLALIFHFFAILRHQSRSFFGHVISKMRMNPTRLRTLPTFKSASKTKPPWNPRTGSRISVIVLGSCRNISLVQLPTIGAPRVQPPTCRHIRSDLLQDLDSSDGHAQSESLCVNYQSQVQVLGCIQSDFKLAGINFVFVFLYSFFCLFSILSISFSKLLPRFSVESAPKVVERGVE